jgi:hypothetical protein
LEEIERVIAAGSAIVNPAVKAVTENVVVSRIVLVTLLGLAVPSQRKAILVRIHLLVCLYNFLDSNDKLIVGRDRETPSERPRLQLQPRSSTGAQSSEAPRSNKSNPFGGAKPIDSDEALKKLEEKRKTKDQGEQ